MDPTRNSSEAGVALIAILLIVALLMGLGAALTTSTTMDIGLRSAFDRTTKGFYAAESGLNRAMGNYRDIFLSFNVPTGSDFNPPAITVGSRTVTYSIRDATTYDALHNPPAITIPPGQLFGGLNSSEYDYIVTSAAVLTTTTEATVNAEFKVGNIPIFQFVAFYKKDLEIAPGADMTLNGRVHSNGDLYLSADNATLLIGDNPPTITTVQVSTQGSIYRGRKRTNTCDSPGTVTVDMLQDTVAPLGNLDPKNFNCSGSSRYKATTADLSAWKGSMVDHVESLSVPDPDNGPRGSGVYWTRADLRIVLNLTSTWTPTAPLVGPTQFTIDVQNADGSVNAGLTTNLRTFMADTAWNTANSSLPGTRPIFYTDVPRAPTGAPNNCNCTDSNASGCTNAVAACYNPTFASATIGSTPSADQNNRVYATGRTMTSTTASPAAGTNANDADYRRGGFYNWREAKWMYMLNINVGDLLAWNRTKYTANPATALFDPSDRTDGGIVLYLSVQGASSNAAANNYGVRIYGSATLPFPNMGADPTGITVVSDQAMYVAGNYNSVTKQPAALIGDTINVLSQAYFTNATTAASQFNDKQSNAAAAPAAAATTVNSAFLAGVDDTVADSGTAGYNGGLENYPRFHEDWSGTAFNYLGSFVSLGNPLHATGKWTDQNYSPPNRNWNFDSDFINAANLPPLTPRFVYVQQVLFTEEFK